MDYDITRNTYLVSVPGARYRGPKNPCNFLSDRCTTCIFCSNMWSLTRIPDTDLLKPFWVSEWWRYRSILYRVPKSLGIFWVIGPSFVLVRQLLKGSWMGASHQKDQAWLEAWNFQLHSPSSQEGRRAGSWANKQSCLHDEASINALSQEVRRTFWWAHPCARGLEHPTSNGQDLLHSGSFWNSLHLHSSLALHLYPFLSHF